MANGQGYQYRKYTNTGQGYRESDAFSEIYPSEKTIKEAIDNMPPALPGGSLGKRFRIYEVSLNNGKVERKRLYIYPGR